MNMTYRTLATAPIIEAVVDIECDMPPALDVADLATQAADALAAQYPTARKNLAEVHHIAAEPNKPPAVTSTHGLAALQFVSKDDRQLVQFRPSGYSFNRLAPYEGLDRYLSEIERTWAIFVRLARPARCRAIRLRYINRLRLPLTAGQLEINDFLTVGPRVVDESRLSIAGFFDQKSLVESDTGNVANVVFATQPLEQDVLPIVFDIEVAAKIDIDPGDWAAVSEKIVSLRDLKNMVFNKSLTPKCLNLFQPVD
jgi:uncharacterized protein (TIGR04255 family)